MTKCYALEQCFLTFFNFVHPCHWLLHSLIPGVTWGHLFQNESYFFVHIYVKGYQFDTHISEIKLFEKWEYFFHAKGYQFDTRTSEIKICLQSCYHYQNKKYSSMWRHWSCYLIFRTSPQATHMVWWPLTYTLQMYGWYDNNHSKLNVHLLDNGTLLYFISTACFSAIHKLAAIFKHGLITNSASQNVVSFHQHMHHLKRVKETESISDWWREFYSAHKYSCCCMKNCKDLLWRMLWLFYKWLHIFEGAKH